MIKISKLECINFMLKSFGGNFKNIGHSFVKDDSCYYKNSDNKKDGLYVDFWYFENSTKTTELIMVYLTADY